jgi:hypothetical protein
MSNYTPALLLPPDLLHFRWPTPCPAYPKLYVILLLLIPYA